MVNAIKGLFISCDIPMAQFIINLNSSLPASQKFIIYKLDNTHLFVQPTVGEMIRSAIQSLGTKILTKNLLNFGQNTTFPESRDP